MIFNNGIKINDAVDIINSGHFVRELWPSQRFICEKGFLKWKSDVVQMSTGSEESKAMSMAIYSVFVLDLCSYQSSWHLLERYAER